MKPIILEPKYSTKEIPGKCIKCLAEQRLNNCLAQLLVEETENKELEESYNALLSFLESPEGKQLRDEAEKHLADGKDVRVKIYSRDGKTKYKIKLS